MNCTNYLRFAIRRSSRYMRNGTYLYDYLADLLAIGMKMPYKVFVADGPERPSANSTWTGTIGMVHRKEADIGVATLVITDERRDVVDFSYPFYLDAITFVTRKVENTSDFSAPYRPFSLDAWLALVLSFVAMTLTLYWSKSRTSLTYNFKIVFCSLIKQPVSYRNPVKKSLMFIWLLSVVFLTSCYLSLLLSFLTLPPITKIRNIQALSREVQSGRYHIIARKGPIIDLLLESGDRSIRAIGRKILKNPMGYGNVMTFLELSEKLNIALVEERNFIKYLKREYYVSNENFSFFMCSVAVKKTFRCRDKLNMVIHRITAAGLYQKILQQSLQESSFFIFLRERLDKSAPKPLTLVHLSGAFLILIVGLSVSCASFLVEILKNCLKKLYFKNKMGNEY